MPALALTPEFVVGDQLLSQRWGDGVPASTLTPEFVMGDPRVKLVTWGRGIFKPKELTDGPLTFVSSMTSRYDGKRLGLGSWCTRNHDRRLAMASLLG